jgi:glutamate/tyrosine decarboxylase-like PLP-dependent enzyme
MTYSTKELLASTAMFAADYDVSVSDNPVFPYGHQVSNLSYGTISEKGNEAQQTIAELQRRAAPGLVSSTGSRYFGYVVGGTLPAALAADWLVSTWDQVASTPNTSPAMHDLESEASSWLRDLFGLPAEMLISYPTCTTTGDMICLAAARSQLLANHGWDVEAKGLWGAPRLRVVLGGEVHVTMLKALSVLGFGKDCVESVPVDEEGRMRTDQLPDLDDRTVLILQAGNVNSGSFDPFAEIIPAAQKAGSWVHVDGAFGLWASASPKLKHLTQSMWQADSLVADGHKWLNTPYDGAMVFCRHEALNRAMATTASYFIKTDEICAQDVTLEFSRRARGVPIWAALHHLGRQGVIDLIERCHHLAGVFAEGLNDIGIDVRNDVVLNQVVGGMPDLETRDAFLEGISKDGTCWFGPTIWQGQPSVRISVSSWRTTEDDVVKSLEAIRRIWNGLQ